MGKCRFLKRPPQRNEPESAPESDPEMDPFGGGQMSENTLETKVFGSFPALRGIHLGLHFRTTFRDILGSPHFQN